ncbi:carboxylesterase/lipase family protein [Streptomyces sp. NPDC058464]|uniref:carboxylesterase/lipase family protein n=1 Tax=Streptomyces sp. NPDC058464 TaxID=3346511 RepID=UPI00364DD4C7
MATEEEHHLCHAWAAAGAVRGRRENAVTAFLGIPYAEPPVGAARFAGPRPAAPWNGVREATSFGPPPPQSRLPGLSAPTTDPPGDDWLTVNVWTRTPDPDAALPVMVWFYGGAYLQGTAAQPDYDGARLARENDVVVVTLNYRLGIEGFAQLDDAPADRGVLDAIAALEWVRQNIAAFGGDPARVTVFGQSAGAGIVAALLAAPRAAGLFRRAIVQSLPGTFLSRELASDVARVLCAELGHPPTAASLARTDPRELATALTPLLADWQRHRPRWGQLASGRTPFAPVVDGDVLPADPWQALENGAARDVDLVVGHTRDEYRIFIALPGLLGRITDEQATQALRALGPGPDAEEAYRKAFPEADAGTLYELVHSDALFRMPSLRLAEAQVAGGGRTFAYEFTWCAPGMGGVLGACHMADYPLVLGNTTAGLAQLLIGADSDDATEAFAARLRATWTAFAATGDPGWPRFEPEQRPVQVLDTECRVVPYPEEASRRLWARQRFTALPLLAP